MMDDLHNEKTPFNASEHAVLCVDDEANILSSLKRMLSLQGYKVSTCESAKEAMDLLKSTSFDLILTDLRMPEMDGIGLLKEIKNLYPTMTRVMLTGNADLESAKAAINQGDVFKYLSKPWDEEETFAIIQEAVLLSAKSRRDLALNETVQTLESRIHEYFITTIKIFSNLMDLRAPKLLSHSKNVALLSSQVAKLMGLEEEEVQEIYISGLLHDIGKIGFSDRLLRTSSHDLPHSDFEIYRKHPVFGSACLKNLDRMKNIAANIRSHHEHLDGEGFPDGLKGDQIPMGAQILCIVETYFELMEGELTGSAMTSMQAIKAIFSQSDTAFDRKILDKFLIAAKKMAARIEQETQSAALLSAPSSPSASSGATAQAQIASSGSSGSSPTPHPTAAGTEKKSTYRPGRGENPLQKAFTYKVLDALVNTYSGAKIDDRRDEKNGFLWVYSGSKRSEDNQKLDEWLTKNGFIYDNKLSGWYYPFD